MAGGKKKLKVVNEDLLRTVVENIYKENGWVSDATDSDILCINDEFTLSLQTVRCQRLSPQNLRWRINFKNCPCPDISIAARMDSTNKIAIDYYIFPSVDLYTYNMFLKEKNSIHFDMYQFDTLRLFYSLVKRTLISEDIVNEK